MIALSASIADTISAARFWEAVEYGAMVGVTIGVAGEYVADFTSVAKSKFWRRRIGKWSTLLLIFALAIELVAVVRTNIISNHAVADLGNQAEQAAKLAGDLGVTVDNLGNFVKTKQAEAKKILDHLNAKRVLTPAQAHAIVADLAKYPIEQSQIMPVWSAPEVTTFASQLDDILTKTFVAMGKKPRANGVPYEMALPALDRTGFPSGVTVTYTLSNPSGARFAKELARLLVANGIAAKAAGEKNDWKGDADHPDPHAASAAFVVIMVGEIP